VNLRTVLVVQRWESHMAISLSCMQDACTAPIPQNSVGPELPKQYGWALPYSKIMP